jgi:AsmA protein
MSKLLKFLAILVVVLLLFAGGALWLLSRIDTKAQFEAAASRAIGLQVVVLGDVSFSLVPALHARLTRVVVSNRGTPLASIGEADVRVEFRPLLRRELRVQRLVLRDINAQIERDEQGRFNFITARRPAAPAAPTSATQVAAALIPAAASVAGLTLERANLRYLDRQLEQEVSANGCSFGGKDVQLLQPGSSELLKNLVFEARVACAEVSTSRITAREMKFSMTTRGGVVRIRSLLMGMLGGQGSGEIDADLSGTLPLYRIEYALKQLRLEQLLATLSAEPLGEGGLDFKANLAMQGSDLAALTRTARGAVVLEGRDLSLAVGNLDQKLARYESSQNFNLVDLGAFLVAGPAGPALTKSYNFASIFRGTRGDTPVRRLLSRWDVQDGIARAQDVAMATRANRLAVKGALDLVGRNFNDMSVALLNEHGCARVEQKISGPFAAPEIKRPSVLGALAGPVKSLFGRAKRLLGLDCKVFYEGEIEA